MSRKNMADLRNDKLTPKPCQQNLLERKWQSIMAVKPGEAFIDQSLDLSERHIKRVFVVSEKGIKSICTVCKMIAWTTFSALTLLRDLPLRCKMRRQITAASMGGCYKVIMQLL